MTDFVRPDPATAPVQPSAIPVAPRPHIARVAIRRVLWSVYALPVTFFFVESSVVSVWSLGALAVLDLVLSMPFYVVVQLHIWDKRTLNGAVWKSYAFGFLAWQAAYGFFIYPMVTGTGFSAVSWMALAFQTPLLFALFRYAFRTWDSSATGDATHPIAGAATGPAYDTPASGNSRLNVIVLSLTAAVLGLGLAGCWAISYVANHPRMTPASLLYSPDVYEVRTPPPAHPYDGSTRPVLAPKDAEHLRGLFEAGEFDELTEELTEIQSAFEADRTQEYVAIEAFELFMRHGDERQLDSWVNRDPGNWVARQARAAYYHECGWDARGGARARETSEEQFEGMEEYFDKALVDAGAVMDGNELVLGAYTIRMSIANARGQADEEHAVFDQCVGLFPDSPLLYRRLQVGLLPRWGGSYVEMEVVATEAVESNAGDPRMYMLFGMIYADQADGFSRNGRLDEAYELYTEALAYGDTPQACLSRARVAVDMKEYQLALEDADRCLEMSPRMPSALLVRALALERLGDRAGALESLEAAESIAPDDEEVIEWRAWADKHL